MAAMERRADIAAININEIPDVARSLHAVDINKVNVREHHASYHIRVRYRKLAPATSLVLFQWYILSEFHIILPDIEGVDDRARGLIDFALKADPGYVAKAVAGTQMRIIVWKDPIIERDELFMFREIN